MNYDVGQIIYVISGETDRIVPMQICEEVRRRTISGEDIVYLVRSGPDKSSFKLDEVKGQVFINLEVAREHLRDKFNDWLEKQVEWTVTSQKTWYAPEIIGTYNG